MKKAVSQVTEFHRAFKISIGCPLTQETCPRSLRRELIREETREYEEAEEANDIIAIADALADLAYVVIGTAVAYGIPFASVFGEVHRSNMSKLGNDGNPIIREDGKVLKGPKYSPPKIKEILEKIELYDELPEEQHPSFNCWRGMHRRCTDPKHEKYKYYGGKGIKVCDRWKKFKTFAQDMGVRPPGYTIERKDPNKDYCPENCIWANLTDQSRNRTTVKLDVKKAEEILTKFNQGVTKTALAKTYKVSKATISDVVNRKTWK